MKWNNPLVSISYIAGKKSYQKQSKQKTVLNSNAIAAWVALLNNHICVFRDLSHSTCLFSPYNCQLYQWRKWKLYHSTSFCILWIVPYLVKNESSLSFFHKKYISVTFLHYQSITAGWRKNTGHSQISTKQPLFGELTRCSKV